MESQKQLGLNYIMLTGILIVLAFVILFFLVSVARGPSEMNISRELLINSGVEKIFPYINNTRKADEWMPWKESDPSVTISYSGPEEGVGSTSSWVSSGKMGVGTAKVIESIANRTVKTQLTYTKPMNMSQLAEISLTPTSNGTVIRWSVSGKNAFVGRLFCAFMNMDKVVGGQFEKGLSNLKRIVEAKS